MTEGRRQVVLFVDDEVDILHSFQDFLESSIPGLEVRIATSGTAALPLLKQDKFDLIVSDYKMPGMDGITFLKLAEDQQPAAPKILLTAFPKLDLAIEAINEVKVAKFLTKPVPPEKMLTIVRALLKLDAPAPTRPRPGFFR